MAKADTIRDSNGPEVDDSFENFSIQNSESNNNNNLTPPAKDK